MRVVFKAHRLCVSLHCRLESNKEEESAQPSTEAYQVSSTVQGYLAHNKTPFPIGPYRNARAVERRDSAGDVERHSMGRLRGNAPLATQHRATRLPTPRELHDTRSCFDRHAALSLNPPAAEPYSRTMPRLLGSGGGFLRARSPCTRAQSR